MSNFSSVNFWERLKDDHWDEYVRDCEAEGAKPRLESFMVWAEDKDLVPEMDYEND